MPKPTALSLQLWNARAAPRAAMLPQKLVPAVVVRHQKGTDHSDSVSKFSLIGKERVGYKREGPLAG